MKTGKMQKTEVEGYRKTGKKEAGRQANMELLRCVAMMMVVGLHYLGKGKLLGDLKSPGMDAAGFTAWILEAMCIVAVNLYMLLTGYFGWKSEFRLSRLVRLYLQVWFYSVAVGGIGYLLERRAGSLTEEQSGFHFFLTLIFPVSMEHYWFMTAYIFLYILLPFIGYAVRRMGRRQLEAGLLLLLVFYCFLKSVVPGRLELDGKGYDFVWYLCMFLVGTYISKYGAGRWDAKGKGLILYFVGIGLAVAEVMALYMLYIRTGRFELIENISMEYNHIFPCIGSIGFFLFFKNIGLQGKIAAAINKISPYTLGVYLLHENVMLRYRWQAWLGSGRVQSVPELILYTLAAMLVVFLAGIAVDACRAWAVGRVHRWLINGKSNHSAYKRLVAGVSRIDALFRE